MKARYSRLSIPCKSTLPQPGPQKQRLKPRLFPIPSPIQPSPNASALQHSATSLPATPLKVSSGSLTSSQGLRKTTTTTTKITLHDLMWCVRKGSDPVPGSAFWSPGLEQMSSLLWKRLRLFHCEVGIVSFIISKVF